MRRIRSGRPHCSSDDDLTVLDRTRLGERQTVLMAESLVFSCDGEDTSVDGCVLIATMEP